MRLILLRHGIAMERAEFALSGKNDSLRPLLPKGIEKTKWAAEALKKWNPNLDFIVTSPFVRALQTANIVKELLKISNLLESNELIPDKPPHEFAKWLSVHAEDCEALLAVGHEPQLSEFASWCLAGKSKSFIDLKKSGMIALEIKSFDRVLPGEAKLLWHVSPKLID